MSGPENCTATTPCKSKKEMPLKGRWGRESPIDSWFMQNAAQKNDNDKVLVTEVTQAQAHSEPPGRRRPGPLLRAAMLLRQSSDESKEAAPVHTPSPIAKPRIQNKRLHDRMKMDEQLQVEAAKKRCFTWGTRNFNFPADTDAAMKDMDTDSDSDWFAPEQKKKGVDLAGRMR